MAKRNPSVLGIWGQDGARVVAAERYWAEPLKWNAAAAKGGRRRRVFCASLADVFEDWQGPMLDTNGDHLYEVDGAFRSCKTGQFFLSPREPLAMSGVRSRLFRLIDATPHLDWLLLTKRPENIRRFWPSYGAPDAGVPGTLGKRLFLRNVWLGTTVENQHYADLRIPELLKCRDLSPVLFLSCEPLLGPVDFFYGPNQRGLLSGIGLVISGGESGPGARPSNPKWFRDLRDQRAASGVPFHHKQNGEWVSVSEVEGDGPHFIFPDGSTVRRVGKKASGRTLDGVVHDAFPEVADLAEKMEVNGG